jgi:predicted DNA-binding transcriptional regulator AlpA
MKKNRMVSIERAKALATQWGAEHEEHARSSAVAARFKDAAPADVIEMYETGRNERGQKLSQDEFAALVERWLKLFGGYPPSTDDAAPDGSTSPAATERDPEPQDDTMLSSREVARLAGISTRTIDRMVRAGRFDPPMRLSPRRRGWPAREVKAWLGRLDEQRRAARQ